MANERIPIEGFPSEYITFLKAASLKRVEINLPNYGACVRIRARINALRATMKREKHPDYQFVAKAAIRIPGELVIKDQYGRKSKAEVARFEQEHPEFQWSLLGAPRDSDVLGAFHAAGIKPDTLDANSLADPLAEFEPNTPSDDELKRLIG